MPHLTCQLRDMEVEVMVSAIVEFGAEPPRLAYQLTPQQDRSTEVIARQQAIRELARRGDAQYAGPSRSRARGHELPHRAWPPLAAVSGEGRGDEASPAAPYPLPLHGAAVPV